MSITLRDVTADNWKECIRLRVAEDQHHFVTANVVSLAESKFDTTCVPLAIYNAEGKMVGFVMYGYDHIDANWWIYRLMVDQDHQARGYGRAAMLQTIERIRQEYPYCEQIVLSYKPDNEVGRKLYASLGFRETGEIIAHEVVARLYLSGEKA